MRLGKNFIASTTGLLILHGVAGYLTDGPLTVGSARADEVVLTALPQQVAGVAEIRVSFMLDPLLTRGLHMGDRWVRRDEFQHIRQPGSLGTIDVRLVGLDRQGRELNVALQGEWAPLADAIAVSQAIGHRVTISMESPGDGLLRVRHGELSETLQLRAIYDGDTDTTQLVIVRAAAIPDPSHS